jgi:hypothetical protein
VLAFLTLLGSIASVQGKPGKTGEKKFPCKSNSKYKLRSTPGQFTVAMVFGCRIMRRWPDGFVVFAISDELLSKLPSAAGDDALVTIVPERIEQLGKNSGYMSWTKHRMRSIVGLTDGDIGFNKGVFPLHHAILAGERLHKANNYIVSEIMIALRRVTEAGFRHKYFLINPAGYSRALSAKDSEYTWDYFNGLADFYGRAASEGRDAIFTVDQ